MDLKKNLIIQLNINVKPKNTRKIIQKFKYLKINVFYLKRQFRQYSIREANLFLLFGIMERGDVKYASIRGLIGIIFFPHQSLLMKKARTCVQAFP